MKAILVLRLCLCEGYFGVKALSVCSRYGGTVQNFGVKLPVMLNKFFQPTEMEAQDFFQRWKQLGA